MVAITRAQNFEDVILARLFEDVDVGFYVDVGANHPEVDSVTKIFYDAGWSGLNIEPVKEYYELLCQERPRDINCLACASDVDGKELSFFEVIGTGLSTNVKSNSEAHMLEGRAIQEHVVGTVTLDKLISNYSIETIHFLKIDVEGAESAVIAGCSLKVTRPWVILVEALDPISKEQNYRDWEDQLIQNDYEFVYFDGLNRFYLAAEHANLKVAFDLPPNIFDPLVSGLMGLRAKQSVSEHEVKHFKRLANEERQAGFRNKSRIEELTRQLGQVRKENQELLVYRSQFDQIISSRLWKFTYPYRRFVGLLNIAKARSSLLIRNLEGRSIKGGVKYLRQYGVRSLLLKVKSIVSQSMKAEHSKPKLPTAREAKLLSKLRGE